MRTRSPLKGWLRVTLIALALATSPWRGASAAQPGDVARGAKLHQSCLQCHGTDIYVLPERNVKSLKALRKEVERWCDHYNPKMTNQEVEDLVAYLNADFYKFR